ncbi:MAG: sulfatase-like hydrolase/transferase [Acidobacteriota bacterium]
MLKSRSLHALLLLSALAVAGCAPSDDESGAALGEALGSQSEPARDVVLITLDTLRYDALSLSGIEGPYNTPTPHLDRVAAEGLTFSFALAHNTITLPSHANILTGRYPYEHGVRENAAYRLPDATPTLAERLKEYGFATGAFVSAYVLDEKFGLAEGFDVYDDHIPRDGEPSALRIWERRAPNTLEAALRWWRTHADQRRFLWLHLFEPHLPYEPPPPFLDAHEDQPYRGEVAALDAFLAGLLEELRSHESPLVLAITADHGEALGDHDEPAHGIFAYQSTIHIPLLLWGEGIPNGSDDRLARHIDLVPTLLQAVGVETPASLPGSSLLGPASPDTTSYFEALSATFDSGWAPLRGLVQGRLKVIDLPIPELYDLEADPGEKNNLASQRRRDFHRLRGLLPEESSWPPARGELTDEAAARLRSLGYLSDDSGTIKSDFGVEDDPKRWIHVEQLKQEYADHLRNDRSREAIATAEAMLREQPSMGLAYTLLAEAQWRAGAQDEALGTMRRAWESGVASPTLTRRLASALLSRGQARAALQVMSRLQDDPDLDTRSLLGQVLRENGRAPEAEALLKTVLAERPGDAITLERLSAVALDLGRPETALEYAGKALDIDDSLAQAWNNLGVAKVMGGDVAGGLEAWRQAIERDPELWDTLYNLGFQAARAGQTELARDALRRFLEGAPPRYAADRPKAEALLLQL